jgi:23S rRNA pseudouridine1911/1915/1917 synthase
MHRLMQQRLKPKVDHIDVHEIRARKSWPGRRLDSYLAAKFHEYSRSFMTALIREGKVTINGGAIKPHYELKRGDELRIELPVFGKITLTPEDIPIEIIHEDDHVLIVNKPPDMVVHPARSHISGTLVNALIFHCDNLPDTDENKVRPGIVHRLDRHTTGVMVVVKDEDSRGWIGKQFEYRKVQKHYRTVVEGEVELDADLVSLPIGRHKKQREKMAVDHKEGREAHSIYTVIERFDGFTYLDVELKTGRTHQIRVHMKAVGHPVVCDAAYGRRQKLYLSELTGGEPADDEAPIIDRQALHAYTLAFNHPGTKQIESYTAPLPADMQSLLTALREHRSKT